MRIVLDDGAYMPERAHPTDAGLDLRTPFEITVPGSVGLSFGLTDAVHIGASVINTGVHIDIPIGYVGMIKSKSGLNVKNGLIAEGVIDAGYTGSIVVKLYNMTDMAYHFLAGDKIAQLVIMPFIAPDMEVVTELDETDRGNNGFGSTGR